MDYCGQIIRTSDGRSESVRSPQRIFDGGITVAKKKVAKKATAAKKPAKKKVAKKGKCCCK